MAWALAAVLFFTASVGAFLGLMPGIVNDDTYITLRYSKNLAEQGQFTYNLGQPTYSLTTPLWGITVGVLGFVTRSYLLLAQLLAGALSLLAALALWRLCRRDLGEMAFLPPVLFLLDPYAIGAASNGTEMGLFAVLEVAFVWRFIRVGNAAIPAVVAGLLLALLMMTRPEGVAVFVLASMYVVFSKGWRRGLSAMTMVGLTAGLLSVPWLVYAMTTYGTVLPTSLILKSVDSGGRMPFSDFATMANLAQLVIKGYPVQLLAMLIGGLILIARWRTDALRQLRHTELGWLSLVLVCGLLLFYFGGLKEKAISSRYLVTVAPFLAILVTYSAMIIRDEIGRSRRGRDILVAAVVCAMTGIVLVNLAALQSRITRGSLEDASRVETGEWIAQNIPESAVIGNLGGAGAIAYYFDGLVFDYDLISSMGEDLQFALKRRSQGVVQPTDFLFKKPDYLVVPSKDVFFDQLGQEIFRNHRYKVIRLISGGSPTATLSRPDSREQ